jgi:hypothetical protein
VSTADGVRKGGSIDTDRLDVPSQIFVLYEDSLGRVASRVTRNLALLVGSCLCWLRTSTYFSDLDLLGQNVHLLLADAQVSRVLADEADSAVRLRIQLVGLSLREKLLLLGYRLVKRR